MISSGQQTPSCFCAEFLSAVIQRRRRKDGNARAAVERHNAQSFRSGDGQHRASMELKVLLSSYETTWNKKEKPFKISNRILLSRVSASTRQ
ncbi:UNVERIFIED_CONTAM: hypothetical protein FKN15_058437 [Acipenser sinensis]